MGRLVGGKGAKQDGRLAGLRISVVQGNLSFGNDYIYQACSVYTGHLG